MRVLAHGPPFRHPTWIDRAVTPALMGIGMQSLGFGLQALVPSMPKQIAWVLFLGGMLLIGFSLFHWVVDTILPKIPIPRWLPEKLRTPIFWAKYKPIVGYVEIPQFYVNDKLGKEKSLEIYTDVFITSVFPYGMTRVNFKPSLVRLYEIFDNKRHVFEFSPVLGSLIWQLGPGETRILRVKFEWSSCEHGLARSPDIDREFDWRLVRVRASLVGENIVSRDLPDVQGHVLGVKERGSE